MRSFFLLFFLFVLFCVSPCFADNTYLDVSCSVPASDGFVSITYKANSTLHVGTLISNMTSESLYFDLTNHVINMPCRCESTSTRLYFYNTSYSKTVSSGTWVQTVVNSGGSSVEVISFAVGGLMGLAFAVASVYKW